MESLSLNAESYPTTTLVLNDRGDILRLSEQLDYSATRSASARDSYADHLYALAAADNAEVLVTRLDDHVRGMVSIQRVQGSGEVMDSSGLAGEGGAEVRVHGFVADLLVDTSYRRRGIGTSLMMSASNIAVVWGAKALALSVPAQSEAAQAFYQSLGFESQFIVMSQNIVAQSA